MFKYLYNTVTTYINNFILFTIHETNELNKLDFIF